MSLHTNITAALFPHSFAVEASRWGWLVLLLYVTFVLLYALSYSEFVRLKLQIARLESGRRSRVLGYLVVALIGAAVAIVYWWVIGDVYTHLQNAEAAAVARTLTEKPDITAKFVYADSIALVLMNHSQAIVRDPGYFMMLWNLDSPTVKNPLPIPSQTFNGDRITLNTEQVPLAIVILDQVAPLIKKGDRLFGFVTVSCSDCVRQRSYYVYAVHGENGWYYELPEERHPEINALIQALPDLQKDPETIFAKSGITRSARRPIGEFQQSL